MSDSEPKGVVFVTKPLSTSGNSPLQETHMKIQILNTQAKSSSGYEQKCAKATPHVTQSFCVQSTPSLAVLGCLLIVYGLISK